MFEMQFQDFEPSGSTKKFMRYLRTQRLNIAGISHPGLFGFHGFTVDAALFMVLLLLEIVGLRTLWVSITENTGQTGFAVMLMIVAAFLLDILFAVLHHLYATGKNSELEFEITLAEEITRNEGGDTAERRKAKAEAERGSRKMVAKLFALVLVLLSFLKIWAFITFTPDAMEEPGQVLFIAVAYVLVAILHVAVTGYFLFALFVKLFLYDPDIRSYRAGTGCNAQKRSYWFKYYPEFDTDIRIREHLLTTEVSATGEKRAMLIAKGVLLDDDVLHFAQKVREPEAKRQIAMNGMLLQLNILQAN